ncbi:MAG: alpha-ketoacid dehydrogenase subunit beta [Methylocella sp.]
MAKKTYRQAINEALRQEMERDPRVILMGEDVAGGLGSPGEQDAWGGPLGVTKGLLPKFGRDRVLDTPISESAFVGAAVGAAANGLRPVAELMFVDFFGVCFDQIYNQAAKFKYMFGGKAVTPLVIRTMYGAGFRAASQHSQCLYPIFTHIPGLKVVLPSNAYEAKGLLIQAIRDDDPVIFLEHKRAYRHVKEEVPDGDYTVPFGKAKIRREGGDCTIITYGYMLIESLEAADALAADGVSCEVIDLMSINPLDEDAVLTSVAKTGRAVIVYEDNKFMGFGAEVAAIIAEKAFQHLDAPVTRVAGPFVPGVPFAITLEDAYLPNAEKIAAAVKKVVAF